MHFVKVGITKLGTKLNTPNIFQCSNQTKILDQNQHGTSYTNWVLARSAGSNHNISHFKRKYPKDRYSIHRLTNLDFMCNLVIYGFKYNLNQNQKIVLLAQFNHVIKVMGKDIENFRFYLGKLIAQVISQMENPPDLVCLGTFISSLVTMGSFFEGRWISLIDDILAQKFDEEYDELFGIIIGLSKYHQQIKLSNNYLQISQDQVVPQIPIIYRNNFQLIRQYVTYNVYNLKQCRLIFQAFYQQNINQRYFWNSMRDWFNIYTKEQLNKKEMSEYFIMKQSAIEKVLHDHGTIRPRPILQELSSIAFIISEFGSISWRFIEFAQDLILYTIENGSTLFQKYQQIVIKQQIEFQALSIQEKIRLNTHIKISKQEQKQNIKQMQKKYRTIFLNPIQIKNNFIVYLLVVLSRAYKQYKQPQQNKKQQQQTNIYDKKKQIYLDPRVKRWLFLQLIKDQMQYTPTQLLILNRCQQFLKDSKINLEELIAEKLCNLRNTIIKFSQIQQFLAIIPLQRYDKLNYVLTDFLNRNHPSQILLMTKHIQKHHLWSYMGLFLIQLPKAINFHEKYYSFQQNCYFLLMLLKNAYAIDAINFQPNLRYQYDAQLQKLKQAIKIITYGRGFKLSLNSYFHKILDYINVVEFFEGGRS